MSQLVWLEGKHTTQNAHCAMSRTRLPSFRRPSVRGELRAVYLVEPYQLQSSTLIDSLEISSFNRQELGWHTIGSSGLFLLIHSLIYEQNLDRICLYFLDYQ